ncbi:hypothetical protein V494_08468 [Pseudogymnoascus sp. VKM F-4513 (FW-928)]|nr:hypothetical protein V494_08468 [Pseudogymnoascus sp. VKM F-4513 (FW-928)]
MTLVFSANSGPLTQLQIGPADILATFSAAYTASGWLGGLDGIRNLISWGNQFLPPASREKQIKLLQGLFTENLKLQTSAFDILTSRHGPVRCEIPTSEHAFGGEHITKIIGFTICALAHEAGYDTAVTLFTEYLAPLLFDDAAELLGALQGQLRETTTMHRLMNEGATLGLPTIFSEASQRYGFSTGDEDWLNRKLQVDTEYLRPTEWHFVIGLLRWLGNGMSIPDGITPGGTIKSPYFTRSGLVARVAGYLQTVGYRISSIQTWQGYPPRPRVNHRTVILVLGGSEETDILMEDLTARLFCNVVLHYTYNTVGAMLHQSLMHFTTAPPEVFQSDFDEIYDSIQSRLQTTYQLQAGDGLGGSLCIACNWKPPSSKAGAIATRLAAIYFPLLGDKIAQCYERIATNGILKSVLDRKKREAFTSERGLDEAIVRFRECTAAILISLIASLSRDDFRNFKHSTTLDLSSPGNLDEGCRIADRSFSSSMKFNEAVQLLATIHAARDFEFNDIDTYKIVGWRYGIYCVIPNLLLDMRPTAESITLACRDVFYANVRVHDDGAIKSGVSKDNMPDTILLEDMMVSGAELSAMEISQHPWVGQAQTAPPDRPLYLGLERPLHYSEPDICFVGRVNGAVVGAVSVLDVLRGIARSLLQDQECHHEAAMVVVNVPASTWIDKKGCIPVGSKETPALLAVRDDPSWALFAIGQSFYNQSCIVLRCNSCALRAASEYEWAEENVVLIGYH